MGEDQAYFKGIETAFIRLRGSPLLLSPADWKVAQQWRHLGMPLEFVVEVLGEVFAAREERGTQDRVNSLRYCAPRVAAAWKRQQELAAPGHRQATAAFDVPQRLRQLSDSLAASSLVGGRIAERLSSLTGGASAVEEALSELDRDMIDQAWESLEQTARQDIDADVDRQLGELRLRLTGEQLDRAADRLRVRLVRRRLALPLLSLFSAPR